MNETELLQKIKDAEQQLADARRMLHRIKKEIPEEELVEYCKGDY